MRMVSPIKCRRKVGEAGDWIKGLRFGTLMTCFFFKKQFQLSVKSRYQIAMTYWGSRSRKYILCYTSSVIGTIVERKKKCENCFKFIDLIVIVHNASLGGIPIFTAKLGSKRGEVKEATHWVLCCIPLGLTESGT